MATRYDGTCSGNAWMNMEKLRTAFFISGSGTTAEAAILACHSGRLLRINPVAVIASRHEAGGIAKAHRLNIPVSVLRRKDYETNDAYGDALLATLQRYRVDVISQNGWLPMTPTNVIEEFHGRIINQHPGPLDSGRPDFGGKGMYGKRVTCARIAYLWATGEDQWTESTIHMVTAEYDQGDVLSTWRLYFEKTGDFEDTASLRTSVDEVCRSFLGIEHENVLSTLDMLSNGNVSHVLRSEPLIPKNHYDTLEQAKKLAIQLYPEG